MIFIYSKIREVTIQGFGKTATKTFIEKIKECEKRAKEGGEMRG